MQPNATASNGQAPTVAVQNHNSGGYQKVHDGHNKRVRGLWVRSGRYYARMTVIDSQTGKKSVLRIPLGDENNRVDTVPQAVAAMRRLQTKREDNSLPVLRRTPKFADYVATYLDLLDRMGDRKRPATIAKERWGLKKWSAHLGEVRLDRISRPMINDFMAKRKVAGVSNRTVNLDIIILRNVLKCAIDDGWLKTLPTANLRPLKFDTKKRELVGEADLQRLCTAAGSPRFTHGRVARHGESGQPLRNAQQFTDYVMLMAYCGSRMSETLRLRWSDVAWSNRQLTVGSDGLAKNRKHRDVDFNAKLEAHLREMHGRRAPDSEWLFPSPQRGERDEAAKTFRETLRLARTAAEMPRLGFHDCRHFFISMCVMSGIDFMTIARWVGHRDGGVLIGKVYGHLNDEHAKKQAQRIEFK